MRVEHLWEGNRFVKGATWLAVNEVNVHLRRTTRACRWWWWWLGQSWWWWGSWWQRVSTRRDERASYIRRATKSFPFPETRNDACFSLQSKMEREKGRHSKEDDDDVVVVRMTTMMMMMMASKWLWWTRSQHSRHCFPPLSRCNPNSLSRSLKVYLVLVSSFELPQMQLGETSLFLLIFILLQFFPLSRAGF